MVTAYNDRDLDAMACADGVVLLAPPDPACCDNVGDARRHWVRQWTSFPDAHAELIRVVAADRTFAAEVVWRGTNIGPLIAGDGRTRPATNRSVESAAVAICDVHDGRVCRIEHYCNTRPEMTEGPAVGTRVVVADDTSA